MRTQSASDGSALLEMRWEVFSKHVRTVSSRSFQGERVSWRSGDVPVLLQPEAEQQEGRMSGWGWGWRGRGGSPGSSPDQRASIVSRSLHLNLV